MRSYLLCLLAICCLFGCTASVWPDQAKDPRPPKSVDHYGDPLPENAVARLGTLRWRHSSIYSPLVFSADGSRLFAISQGEVLVWETATGRLHGKLPGKSLSSHCLVISNDGKFLAAADDNGVVLLWDLSSGKEPRRLEGHIGESCALAFAPDGQSLASVAGDRNVVLHVGVVDNQLMFQSRTDPDRLARIWDVSTGKLKRTVGPHPDPISAVTYLADGKLVATACTRGVVRIWNLDSGQEVRQFAGIGTSIYDLQLSNDGKSLIGVIRVDSRYSLKHWDIATGKPLAAPVELPDFASKLTFSRDRKHLAVSGSGMIELYDTQTGKKIRRVDDKKSWFDGIAFSPNGQLLAGAYGPQICMWETGTGKEQFVWPAHNQSVQFIRFLPDSKTILTNGMDGTVRLWDVTGKHLRELAAGQGDRKTCLELSPDGKTLAFNDGHSSGFLWDIAADKKLAALPEFGSMKAIQRLAFTPDGKSFAISSRNSIQIISTSGGRIISSSPMNVTVRLYDTATAKELHNFGEDFAVENHLAFSSDGSQLIYMDHEFHKWDVSLRKKLVHTQKVPAARVLFFDPDGFTMGVATNSTFLGGLEDGVALWNASDGKITRTLPVHPTEQFFAIAPNGKFAAMAPAQWSKRWICFRDISNGKKLATFGIPDQRITAAAFSPDGKYLVTANDDSSLLVWDVPTILGQKRIPAKMNPDELEKCWTDLGAAQEEIAITSLDRLVESPDAALPLIKKRVQPVSTDKIGRWLTDLDSNVFAQREKAMHELLRMEFAAIKHLQQLLAEKPPLEVKRRAELLLKKLADPITVPELLNSWRTVTILEQIDTPASRAILEALAKGAPEARLTQDAQTALQRLKK